MRESVGTDTVEVGGEVYKGRAVVLATGFTLAAGFGHRWADHHHRNSGDGLPPQTAPSSRAAGSSAWSSPVELHVGTDVTIVEASPPGTQEDPCSKALERAFRKRKITFHTGVRFSSAAQDDKSVTVTLEDGKTITADVLLVAGGWPRTTGVGYEENGVTSTAASCRSTPICRPTCPASMRSATSCRACSWPTAAWQGIYPPSTSPD